MAHLSWRRLWIRIRHWEYWPMHLVYVPVYLYWFWLCLRSRSVAFFLATNPGIPYGGLFGDSKWTVLRKIPDAWKPRTLLVPAGTPVETVLTQIAGSGIDFPLIAKPDLGERGFLVEKLDDAAALRAYFAHHPPDLLIQEYIAWTEEVSVLYYRYPDSPRGAITSITLKEFLHVRGDGQSTLRQLIEASPRALLQLDALTPRLGARLDSIPAPGETVELMPIGNHSRGTTFLDGTAHIDDTWVATFDQIGSQLEGICFGRFDIRCRSIEALRRGEDFKILEINGVKSEPIHIYQPGYSLWRAYGVLFRQWRTIYEISRHNRRRGFVLPSSLAVIRDFRAYLRSKRRTAERFALSRP
ncbi:MAG: D-alanine--D-alanine ligase [Bacteroidia bacterium]